MVLENLTWSLKSPWKMVAIFCMNPACTHRHSSEVLLWGSQQCSRFLRLHQDLMENNDFINSKCVWLVHKCNCYIAGNFSNNVRSHWLLLGHMTSNNERAFFKISEQAKLQKNNYKKRNNIVKSMTSKSKSALLPANVDWWPFLQRGLMNFQL